MADLNKLLNDAKTRGDRLSSGVRELLGSYEDLYREAHNQFISERIAANGDMSGLNEFNRLVNVIRRNRDVVGAIQRGLKSLRSVDGFSFVEEDVAEEKQAQTAKKTQTAERKKRRAKQQEELEMAQAQAPTLDELIEGPPELPEEEPPVEESSADEVTNE